MTTLESFLRAQMAEGRSDFRLRAFLNGGELEISIEPRTAAGGRVDLDVRGDMARVKREVLMPKRFALKGAVIGKDIVRSIVVTGGRIELEFSDGRKVSQELANTARVA